MTRTDLDALESAIEAHANGSSTGDAVTASPGDDAGASAMAATELQPEQAREQGTADDAARLLFRYLTVEEWRDYRAVMSVFAGTYFSEFTPDEVAAVLAARGFAVDPDTVGERLESLRRWGNLTVSSATGTPSSLADYYKRRNRYLITRVGQEVHDAVEGVLARVDEVRDVSTGRLRSMLAALRALAATDVESADPTNLADLVRAVFDPHQAFTSEITQFFAALNQWQSRYDLTPEEFSFFAEVLVGYVAERLDDIERASRPIALVLVSLADRVPLVVERANRGLASRVEQAGLSDTVSVSRAAGSSTDDWDHLAGWFVGRPERPARMDQLRRDAVSAIRSLTLNLTRLSRVGVGSSSRRTDFLRLAGIIHRRAEIDPAPLLAAALGMYPAQHWGATASDAGDPVGSSTSWWDAPVAEVPISLRERGDTSSRGRSSPIADRSAAQESLRRRRQLELEAIRRVDAELLAHDPIAGSIVSQAALDRFEQLVGRALAIMPVRAGRVEHVDGAICCVVERMRGEHTAVSSPEGTLTLLGLAVSLRRPEAALPVGAAPVGGAQ